MGNNFYPVIEITGQLLSANSLKNCLIHGFNATSTILGQEVAECVLEVALVKILGQNLGQQTAVSIEAAPQLKKFTHTHTTDDGRTDRKEYV